MNKVLNFALVASLATSAFSQEAPKALRHEMMFNVGVNMAGVERGDNNSIHGPFSTDWANAPIHLNVGHLYAVNPFVEHRSYARLFSCGRCKQCRRIHHQQHQSNGGD